MNVTNVLRLIPPRAQNVLTATDTINGFRFSNGCEVSDVSVAEREDARGHRDKRTSGFHL